MWAEASTESGPPATPGRWTALLVLSAAFAAAVGISAVFLALVRHFDNVVSANDQTITALCVVGLIIARTATLTVLTLLLVAVARELGYRPEWFWKAGGKTTGA